MNENKELDKRVALAMGWNYEPDQAVRFHKSDHHSYIEYTDIFTLNGSLVETAEEWLPTTDPAAWYKVEQWICDHPMLIELYARKLATSVTGRGAFDALLYGCIPGRKDVDFSAVSKVLTAPLVTRCRAFLAAVEGGDQ